MAVAASLVVVVDVDELDRGEKGAVAGVDVDVMDDEGVISSGWSGKKYPRGTSDVGGANIGGCGC